MDAETRLVEQGIPPTRISWLKDAIEEQTVEVFEDYGVEIENESEVCGAITEKALQEVLDLADSLDVSVETQFERVCDDFEDGSDVAGRSTVLFVASLLTHQDDVPDEFRELGGAVLSDNYS